MIKIHLIECNKLINNIIRINLFLTLIISIQVFMCNNLGFKLFFLCKNVYVWMYLQIRHNNNNYYGSIFLHIFTRMFLENVITSIFSNL